MCHSCPSVSRDDDNSNTIKVAGTNQRLSVRLNREPSRRSKYLATFLRRRPTHDELKAQGIIKVMADDGVDGRLQELFILFRTAGFLDAS